MFGDPYGEWQRIRGTGDSGAVLVRPDGHIAWRACQAGEKELQALAEAAARLLGRDAAPSPPRAAPARGPRALALRRERID